MGSASGGRLTVGRAAAEQAGTPPPAALGSGGGGGSGGSINYSPSLEARRELERSREATGSAVKALERLAARGPDTPPGAATLLRDPPSRPSFATLLRG